MWITLQELLKQSYHYEGLETNDLNLINNHKIKLS